MKYYIGLDAHSRTSTFVTLDKIGKEVSREEIPTTEFALIQYVKKFKGKKALTVEESHIADWVYGILRNQVTEIIVCDPLKVSKKTRSKTDYIDALHLAKELRSGNLHAVYHDPDNDLMSLRVLVKQYEGVIRDIRRTKSRLKALFLSEANPQVGRKVFTAPEIVDELSSETKKFIAKNLQDQISQQEALRGLYREKFKEHWHAKKVIRQLDSIPGFSVIRSCQVAALIGTGDRFTNKHHLWSYAGLVNHRQVSAGISYGVKKSVGRKQLKGIFIEAAQAICTVTDNNDLRSLYDRLRSEGFNHKKARRALARKVASICLAIMKTGEEYRDSRIRNKKTS